MRRVSVIGCLCLLCLLPEWGRCVAAVPMRWSVSGMAGSMMRGSIADEWLGGRPVVGAEISLEFLPTGKWHSLQQWNNASVGIALDYLNLTNDRMLGQAFCPYVFMNVPLVRLPHFVLGIRPGIGMGFVTKTYYNTVSPDKRGEPGSIKYPDANGAIGSHTNAYFAEALYMEFPVAKGWAVRASYGWYHISNGSVRQPNSGYNMFNAMIGVSYVPQSDHYVPPPTDVPKRLYEGKRWDVEAAVSGGVRQAYFADQRFYGAGTVSLSAHWRAWSIFRIGGGVDVFYDGFYRSVCDEFALADRNAPVTLYGKTYLHESRVENCFRMGVSVQPEFVIGRLTAGFHFGVYLYDPVKNKEPYQDAAAAMEKGERLHRSVFYKYDILNAGVFQDGWLYTRILLKYHCTKHLFVQAGMKAHLTKVEFLETGLGVAF